MSQTAARRNRLAAARTFPQAHCPHCGASLARVVHPVQHLARCERIAAETTAVEAAQHPEPRPRPSWPRRLLDALGMTSRGATE